MAAAAANAAGCASCKSRLHAKLSEIQQDGRRTRDRRAKTGWLADWLLPATAGRCGRRAERGGALWLAKTAGGLRRGRVGRGEANLKGSKWANLHYYTVCSSSRRINIKGNELRLAALNYYYYCLENLSRTRFFLVSSYFIILCLLWIWYMRKLDSFCINTLCRFFFLLTQLPCYVTHRWCTFLGCIQMKGK